MEATQNVVEERVQWWMVSCDNCWKVVSNPMATACGHLYCSPCLVELGVTTPPLICPACNAALPEEAMENMPVTAEIISTNHVQPSRVRMEVVQRQIDERREHARERRVELLRRLNDVMGERIAQLERGMESMTRVNTDMLTQMELRDTAINELRVHIAQMEERGDNRARENIELLLDRMEMRARIQQLENDAAGRASPTLGPQSNQPRWRRRGSSPSSPTPRRRRSSPPPIALSSGNLTRPVPAEESSDCWEFHSPCLCRGI